MYLNSIVITTIIVGISTQEVDSLSVQLERSNTPVQDIETNILLREDKNRDKKVKIQLYYESMCPYCKDFYTNSLEEVYHKLQIYLDVQTYPYGKAKTIINPDGTFDFKCQHGNDECYGNMLHACAIEILANVTASIDFNTCLMKTDSNDAAADMCGQQLGVDAASMIECAKGQKGKDLLKYYGEESHKVNYKYVPFVLINGVEWNQDTDDNFLKRVCKEFEEQPSPCKGSFNKF